MPLQLARQPRRLYRTNTLKKVICQLRHPYQHRYDEPAYLTAFQSRLGDRLPRTSKQTQLALVLSPTGVATMQPAAPFTGSQFWRFTDLEGHWMASVAPDFVSLEAEEFHYSRFEDFAERFQPLLEALGELGVSVQERLGFRFVNEIRHPDAKLPTDWRRFINEELLGIVGGGKFGDDVIHAWQEIRLREANGVIVIRHGYVGAEVTRDGPYYSIDLDYFDETPKGLDRAETLSELAAFHDVLKDIFEMSITEELRNHLVVKEELTRS